MRKPKDAILAVLGDANGMKTRLYGPHSLTLSEYMAPGNYANAESVERGAEGDKFNWVAFSSYGEDGYVNTRDLKAQLERVFVDNDLCQNVHATIHHNGDEMAHRVEYRFHTFGVEPSAGLDDLDFCPSCGWNTQHLKCNAVPDDHPDEACHYICPKCDIDTGITTPCIRQITLNAQFKLDAYLTRSPNIVSAVNLEVNNAVGEIVIGYALDENNLRAMMVNVPGYKPGSNMSADIERLRNTRRRS